MLALKVFSFLLVVHTVFGNDLENKVQERLHEDVGLDIFELIAKYGYKSEQHSVVTEDGYILGVHRITGRLDEETTNTKKPAILLMHGLLSSSADYCNNGKASLAYLLADRGYDVWLGNARGNTWSRNHTTLDPDSEDKEEKAKFWTYSWHEIGVYDLPAIIDKVIKETGEEKIFYTGHSQGTTAFFVMGSERPEYNDKIRLMVALAPVAIMKNMYSPIFKFLAIYAEQIGNVTDQIGLYEFLPHSKLIEEVGKAVCHETAPLKELCSHLLFLICGYDSEQLDYALIPVITTNAPAGASSKQFLHYAQEIISGVFRKYDYGMGINLIKYGQPSPPKYETKRITAPIGLFYSQNDWLAAEVDVEELASELPNVAKLHRVAFKLFNHLDFIWAIDAAELVYKDVLDLIEQY